MGRDIMDRIVDTPAPDRNSFIRYFYENDALMNIHNEVIFSVLGRYNCFAGCKVCYTEKHFKEALPKFKNFIPKEINSDIEQQWHNLFDHFKHISNIDDLFWMKHEQPHLYEWYQKHSHRFIWGSMTDNNFIRTQPIFLNELSADTKIQEISFSTSWLDKINKQEIFDMLKKLNDRNGIQKIKFILTTEDNTSLDLLSKWVEDNGIGYTCSHHDFNEITQKLNTDIPQAEHIASFDSDVFYVCRESNYLQHNGFFLTLIESIDVNNKPYYQFNEFDAVKHLSAMIQGKVDLYTKWVNQNANALDIDQNKDYFDYFKWVSNNVKVNHNYNFIPIDLLNAKHRYYHKLTNNEWQITDYGLLKNGTTDVVPLLEVHNGN